MTDTPTITVRPDAKGRVALGEFAKGVSSFRVHKEEGGRLVLEPYVEIPERERWLYKNPVALEMVRQGLRESAEGKTVRMESFAKYIDIELDETN